MSSFAKNTSCLYFYNWNFCHVIIGVNGIYSKTILFLFSFYKTPSWSLTRFSSTLPKRRKYFLARPSKLDTDYLPETFFCSSQPLSGRDDGLSFSKDVVTPNPFTILFDSSLTCVSLHGPPSLPAFLWLKNLLSPDHLNRLVFCCVVVTVVTGGDVLQRFGSPCTAFWRYGIGVALWFTCSHVKLL